MNTPHPKIAVCSDTSPHRPHLDDGPRGLCAGVPDPDDFTYACVMLFEALNAAELSCTHLRPARRPCRNCVVAALLDLEVFRPVLFPEDSK